MCTEACFSPVFRWHIVFTNASKSIKTKSSLEDLFVITLAQLKHKCFLEYEGEYSKWPQTAMCINYGDE